MNTGHQLIACLVVLLTSTATPVGAITPHGRHITGTIQHVDASAQEVEMLREDKGTLITFIWNKRTDFLANAHFTDAAILKNGVRVEVSYHEPFFGKPFVTKVTLLPPAKLTTKSK